MSTMIEITGIGIHERDLECGAGLGRRLAEDWERRFSRFRRDSVLSRLNASKGRAISVDDTLIDLLETATLAVRRTAGRFDPSVLPALEAIGYDRSIERLRGSPASAIRHSQPALGRAGWDRVRIDRNRGEASLPPGMRIDLGGIAKGAFVDRLAAELADWPGGSIDAGGDLWVWGEAPHGDAWAIGIEDPFQPERDLLVALLPAAVGIGIATSAAHRRCWSIGDCRLHHLIDPRTGLPVADGIRGATAFAPALTAAEIATKALMIAATEPPIVDLFGASAAVLAYLDGRVDILAERTRDGGAAPLLTSTYRAA
jgi:thiamine biosynthesis lipoprotein